jgi:phage terminase large subunit
MCAVKVNKSLRFHKLQRQVHQDRRRYRVIVAGRRWGKSQLSKISLIINAARMRKCLVWYVAPTYQMARSIMWEDIKASIPRAWMRKINETRMSITLANGSRIELKGADKPDTLRGVGLHFVVIDEAQDIKEETWEMVLRPTLATTNGRVLFIGTPKSFNWLYDKFMLGQRGDVVRDERGRWVKNDWKSWQFPTITSPFIPKKEIEQARRDMDPRSFDQEFLASFTTMSGRVYYPFDRNTHVQECPFNPRLPIFIGMDFNIDPMSAVICQEQLNGEIWAVDEAVHYGSNAQDMAEHLAQHYFRHMGQIAIFPDPAGNNRNHDRGETSLDILREAGFTDLQFKRKHPLVHDRINTVNRLLRTADGAIRLRIDPKCRKFIESLEQTVYKPGSREVDKKKGTEHVTDAFGYYADYRHPMREALILGVSI